jgi:hypothetical protein
MKKTILLLIMLLVSLSSQATLITMELNQDSYEVGDVLTAHFIISDIEDDSLGFKKLLASFDFKVSWDNSMLEYVSNQFGNKLNIGSEGSDPFIDVMSNSLGLSEVSYAFGDELLPVQNGLSSFVLASVDFNVTSNGSGTLDLSNVMLSDDFGGAFTDVNSRNKAYSVIPGNPVDVPESASIVLILMGLTLLVRQQKMN